MSRAILKTLRMVSLRKTGPWRLLRILLTLDTSRPTRRAISTCVIIDPSQSGQPGHVHSTGPTEDKFELGSVSRKIMGCLPISQFGGVPRGRAGLPMEIRFCLRTGSISIVITHLFAGVRRHEFWG